LLSAFARQHVTVAISGDGGDELLAGYSRFMSTIQEFASSPQETARHVGDAYYSDRILVAPDPYIKTLFGDVPAGLARHLCGLRERLNQDEMPLHARLRQTDLENYMPGAVLPKMDRMSMRHSLEVRTPFLNRELAAFAERLGEKALYSGGVGKQLLRRVACRYLPAELVNMPKRGFAIPTSQWAPKELWTLTRQMLFSDDSRLLQVFGAGRLEAFIGREDQFSGPTVYRVWGLVMLESWCRHHQITLPRLSVEARRGGASKSDGMGRTLFARRVAPGSYAAVVMAARDSEKAAVELEQSLERNDLLCLAMTRDNPQLGRPNVFDRESVVYSLDLKDLASRSAWLAQASLMLIDSSALSQLGASELKVLQLSGVKEVLSLDPFRSDGQVIRLSIRQSESIWWRWWRRRQRRRAIVSQHVVASLAPPVSGQVFHLELPMHAVMTEDNSEQKNQYAHYAVRVGEQQLPPLPVRSEVLASEGDGRYHVFGSTLALSWPCAVAHDENIVIARSDANTDEFHSIEVPAPIGGGQVPAQAWTSAPMYSEIPLHGSGGTVIFIGTFLSDDIPALEKIWHAQTDNEAPPMLITVTPLSADLIAHLPHGLIHCALDRSPIDDWLVFVPDLSDYRSSLWPKWSEYGPYPAILLGHLRKRSPRQLIVIGEAAHKYVHRLQILGCLISN
jgi:hypothetical protein